MVLDFPSDCMHMMDLGNMCGLMDKMMNLNQLDLEVATKLVALVLPFIPSDFPRRVRSLNEFIHFKAAEFRFYAVYFGPLFFKLCCKDERFYQNYMLFFVGYRLLMGRNGVVSAEDLRDARKFLHLFVTDYAQLYGAKHVTFNIHALLHVGDYVERFGPINSFSCYRFENYYQMLRKWIRRSGAYFSQALKRWSQTHGNVLKKSSNQNSFGSHSIKPGKKDSCVMLKNGEIYTIVKSVVTFNGVEFYGNRFEQKEEFFTTPVLSSRFDIFLVSSLSNIETSFNIDDIQTKMIRFPYEDKFVVNPIIHYNYDTMSE